MREDKIGGDCLTDEVEGDSEKRGDFVGGGYLFFAGAGRF